MSHSRQHVSFSDCCLSLQCTDEIAPTYTDTILLRQHLQNFDYNKDILTYLQNKCYTGETEHMYVDST